MSLPDARMDEEQEREVSRELEREREVEHRPEKGTPAEHYLPSDVANFVRAGVIPSSSIAFRLIFMTSAMAPQFQVNLTHSRFLRDIVEGEPPQGKVDEYVRLVHPFEADRLMTEIRLTVSRNGLTYVRLSRFLGVPTTDEPDDRGALVQRNWFKITGSLGTEIEMTFDDTQLSFVMMLLAIRRMGFAETYMGRIL
ncbi:hypothetical protein HD554DRAFT_2036343 [Boletus coccyginus]|nr:hypothetical protein HD554DRAFT_2036343 [Boletus coccyginus]